MNRIDKKLLKYGFKKTEESSQYIKYRKPVSSYQDTHCIDIVKNPDKGIIIHIYKQGITPDCCGNSLSVPLAIFKLIYKKVKRFSRK